MVTTTPAVREIALNLKIDVPIIFPDCNRLKNSYLTALFDQVFVGILPLVHGIVVHEDVSANRGDVQPTPRIGDKVDHNGISDGDGVDRLRDPRTRERPHYRSIDGHRGAAADAVDLERRKDVPGLIDCQCATGTRKRYDAGRQ